VWVSTEQKIALIENKIAKVMNSLRKDISGKGACGADARLAGDVIFCKLVVEFTQLERRLLSFIHGDPHIQNRYYETIREPLKKVLDTCIKNIFPEISVNNVDIKTNVKQAYLYITVDLSHDIEKMIRNGEVDIPVKDCLPPTKLRVIG
jgi:uncharacterized protein YbcI